MSYMGAGRCLGPEGNRVSLGERGEGGPSPPECRGDNSQCSVRKEATWRRKKESGMIKKDQRQQSEHFLDKDINKCDHA